MKRFEIHVPDVVLADLRARLLRARWPDEVQGAGWDYGTSLPFLRGICDYWLDGFDWRAVESRLNAMPQYMTEIDGYRVHFVYSKGRGASCLPLVLTSGWPSSFAEYERVIGPLTDPQAHGASAHDAFDVIIPTIPGFGFSGPVGRKGFVRVDHLWRKLLTQILGYSSFVAHGTDVGARVTSDLGRHHGDVVTAIHLGSVDLDWPTVTPDESELGEEERDYLRRVSDWDKQEGAYAEIQATFPQTVAYGLNDSPIGLASWILEKYHRWSDGGADGISAFARDDLLANVMIYWVTGTIGSSMRRYYEVRKQKRVTTPVATPTAIAMFPGERLLRVPRAWAQRTYNIQRWKDMPCGGHFPALEQPDLLVQDLRDAFRMYRN